MSLVGMVISNIPPWTRQASINS